MTEFAIEGIYETHLPVTDLARSVAFYRDVMGLELATEIPARGITFFWVGDKRTGMLGLWHAGSAPLHMTLHFAFRASLQTVLATPAQLNSHGVTPRGFNGEPVSEPVVISWMPAASVYCKDPDNHSIEILSVVDGEPNKDLGVIPYSHWITATGT